MGEERERECVRERKRERVKSEKQQYRMERERECKERIPLRDESPIHRPLDTHAHRCGTVTTCNGLGTKS